MEQPRGGGPPAEVHEDPGPRPEDSGAGLPIIEFGNDRDRRNFLRWAVVFGAGASLVVATRDRAATAQKQRDVDILNYALTLEFLERDFFTRGAGAGLLGPRAQELMEAIRGHEEQHVSLLGSAVDDLGGTPVNAPRIRYPEGTFRRRATWLQTAAKLEALAVRAYHGQVTRIRSAEILAAAASIAGAESRHAAVTADLAGRNPFPAPLEGSLTQSRVLKAARPFLGS
jgi:rubrerythrin